MKIVVFSDSHGNTSNMKAVINREKPDLILHAGDVVRDTYELRRTFPNLPLEQVCGNCDYSGDAPNQLIVEAEGYRIMLTHGHLYHVKLGIGALLEAARKARVDAVVFGHTHEALCSLHGELWILNPGSIRPGWQCSYGVIEVTGNEMSCRAVEFEKEV